MATATTVGFMGTSRAQKPGLDVVARTLRHRLTQTKSESTLWAFDTPNGSGFQGNAVRYQQGDHLSVNLHSELEDRVSIHWHGLRLPNTMDGTEMVQLGVRRGDPPFNYAIKLKDPGTHWFHSHQRSWEQVARGLYGMLIVEDQNEPQLFDVPIILDDWQLTPQGSHEVSTLGNDHDWSHGGRVGNHVTVNGVEQPVIHIPETGWVRLRILNAATAAFFMPSVDATETFVIAYDGYGIEARRPVGNAALLGPGQRIDLIFDASTIARDGASIQNANHRICTLKTSGALQPVNTTRNPVDAFRAYDAPELEPTQNAHQTTTLVMTGGAMGNLSGLTLNNETVSFTELVEAKRFWGFNGKADGMQDPSTYNGWENPFFNAFVGETVDISLVNDTRWPHTIHVHGQHFRVRSNPALPHENGLFRDSINIAPGDTVKIGLKAHARGWWPIHCHMLGHQAAGMATWYNIT